MINYKNNFIFNVLDEKAAKMFAQNTSFIFYDRRIKTAFRKIIAAPKPLVKYYFTDSTMSRIKQMDLTHCYPTKLGYLFEKFGQEVGICISKENNLAFAYIITATNIQLIVTSGTNKSARASLDDFGKENYAPWMKSIVGSCVISYHTDIPEILPNNTWSIINKKDIEYSKMNKELIREIQNIGKELKKLPSGLSFSDITSKDSALIFNLMEDSKIKSYKIWDAIKMFIFLKTAKVIDQTFISENQNYGSKSKSKQNESNGIIIVDSTWDSSIHVINPFAVSGYFRDQPKKNKKNEWYKELIYIDSYMKSGYHRNAKSIPDAVS